LKIKLTIKNMWIKNIIKKEYKDLTREEIINRLNNIVKKYDK